MTHPKARRPAGFLCEGRQPPVAHSCLGWDIVVGGRRPRLPLPRLDPCVTFGDECTFVLDIVE